MSFLRSVIADARPSRAASVPTNEPPQPAGSFSHYPASNQSAAETRQNSFKPNSPASISQPKVSITSPQKAAQSVEANTNAVPAESVISSQKPIHESVTSWQEKSSLTGKEVPVANHLNQAEKIASEVVVNNLSENITPEENLFESTLDRQILQESENSYFSPTVETNLKPELRNTFLQTPDVEFAVNDFTSEDVATPTDIQEQNQTEFTTNNQTNDNRSESDQNLAKPVIQAQLADKIESPATSTQQSATLAEANENGSKTTIMNRDRLLSAESQTQILNQDSVSELQSEVVKATTEIKPQTKTSVPQTQVDGLTRRLVNKPETPATNQKTIARQVTDNSASTKKSVSPTTGVKPDSVPVVQSQSTNSMPQSSQAKPLTQAKATNKSAFLPNGDGLATSINRAPSIPANTPSVKIGQVDVFIEAPQRSKSPAAMASRPSSSLASRHYLRRL